MVQTSYKDKSYERRRRDSGEKIGSEFMEKVIKINRVTKVCKGGRRLAFRVLVIVGDLNGRVSVALGKAKEVPIAIRKGIERGKKSLQSVNIVGGTIPHTVVGKFGASQVIIKPAPTGTGVIAGGSVRILLEAVGLRNVVAKSLGSKNPVNSARAALCGLASLMDLEEVRKARGKKLSVRFYDDDDKQGKAAEAALRDESDKGQGFRAATSKKETKQETAETKAVTKDK